MSNRKKSTIYYPIYLKMALDEIKENDNSGRTLNQIVIDTLLKDKELTALINKIKKQEKDATK